MEKTKNSWKESNRKYRLKNREKVNLSSLRDKNTILPNGLTKYQNDALKRFGLDPEKYLEMLKNQDNKCAICGKEEITLTTKGTKRRLSIDHDHKTGKVRDLLCNKCNTGLGCYEDSVELIQKVIKYLEKHGENQK